MLPDAIEVAAAVATAALELQSMKILRAFDAPVEGTNEWEAFEGTEIAGVGAAIIPPAAAAALELHSRKTLRAFGTPVDGTTEWDAFQGPEIAGVGATVTLLVVEPMCAVVELDAVIGMTIGPGVALATVKGEPGICKCAGWEVKVGEDARDAGTEGGPVSARTTELRSESHPLMRFSLEDIAGAPETNVSFYKRTTRLSVLVTNWP